MLKINHTFGGILLVSGTAIGAGMLALPVTTALMGLIPSLILFVFCWLCMLATAFFFLDVNLAIKGEPNIISMARRTLGPWGQALSWVVYLLLLYSLLAAYIAGSAPIFTAAIHAATGWMPPAWMGMFMLPLLFGGILYFGTQGVDLINRILMAGLLVSFVVLIAFVPSHIELNLLAHIDFKPLVLGLPLIVTAFGYHVIIPTLSTYMNHDRKKLKKALIIGSILPLIFYTIWQVLVLGVVPLDGTHGLIGAWRAGTAATGPLAYLIKNPWISRSAQLFSIFAITTSFIGLALSLSDFLVDGFKIKKSWEGKLFAILLTFVPPLIFVFTYRRGFVVALEYAGAFVAILLWFLPAVMAWNLKKPKFYKTAKAKALMIFIMIAAIGIVVIDILEQLGTLHPLIAHYVQA
ncbi:MAG: tyrosine transporter [Chlamydiales bacterium]|nr:tyrosine transporter [Chlamydiales bacterium]